MAKKGKFKREDVERDVARISSALQGFSKIKFCGSYRRNLPVLGDLDVVVTPSGDESLLISSIKSLAKEVLANGSKVVRILLDNDLQVDFYVCSDRLFGSFCLFLTGSASFNIKCRSLAKRFGWRLSQYGLLDENGTEVSVDEIGILECLGLNEFADPVTRSINF